MKYFFGILLLVYIFLPASCNSDPGKEVSDSSFQEVYQLSEMALLMEDMYSELEKIRPDVMENKSIGAFPGMLNKIHTAELTNTFERTFEFERFAELLLENQKTLYDSPADSNRMELYNTVVRNCITCHQSPAGCPGPIPRISGLLIPIQ